MSLESFEFHDRVVDFRLRERRYYGELDEYHTVSLDCSHIQSLPEYKQENEKDWIESAGSGEATAPELSRDSVWIPTANCYVQFASVYVRNFNSKGPGDGHEYTHGPFRFYGPPPPSVSLVSERNVTLLRVSLIDANDELLEVIRTGRRILEDLSSTEFEKLVSAILRNHGYKVELTQRTRDGGYDLFALSDNPCGLDLRVIVECKKYAPGRPVGISVVRQLWGIMNSPAITVDRGVIATTSRLSRDAAELVESLWKLSAWEGKDLLRFAGFKETKYGLWVPE